MPRIRGRVGQIEEPPEYKGKWIFELFLTTIGGGEGEAMGQFGPWETEAIAQAELRKAARLACEAIEKAAIGSASGKYVDLKTNEVRRWDKGDEN